MKSNCSSNITILINSCDSFSDMWGNIIALYNKHWNNHPPLYIVSDTNQEKLFENNVLVINKQMSDRIIEAINFVKTDYIFFSFDDYYPKKDVNSCLLYEIVDEMQQKNISYCRLFKKPFSKGSKHKFLKYRYLPLKNFYEVNFYPSIWKKDDLLKVLKQGEEIWKAEARLTKRAKDNNLSSIWRKQKGIFEFVDIVRKGKYLRSGYRFLKKEHLYISKRQKRTIRETISLNARIFLSDHLPKFLKNKIKKVFNRKGKVFYSDYAENDD